MSIKASGLYGIGLALLAVGAIAACSSDDNGGTNNNTAGTGAGGSGTAGTGMAGAGTAGTGTAGTGTAGTGTAGNGGSGGGGNAQACAGDLPKSSLITDFSDLMAGSSGQLTFMNGVPGGTFTYSGNAITAAAVDMALNIKGTVSGYHGFGVYLNSCVDASAYTGVSFKIKGNVGPGAKLNFRVQLNSDTPIDVTNHKGTCMPADPADAYPDCHSPAVDITDISETEKTVMINFSELSGGKPTATVDPKEIVGFEWAFTWPVMSTGGGGAGGGGAGGGGAGGAAGGGAGGGGGESAGTGGAAAGTGGDAGGSAGGASGGAGGAPAAGYNVDLTIDDFMFLGGPAGGTGGAGGADTGGAGGAAAGTGGAGGAAGGGAGGTGGAAAGSGGTTP